MREDVILEVDPSHPNPSHPIYVRGEPLRQALLKTYTQNCEQNKIAVLGNLVLRYFEMHQ